MNSHLKIFSKKCRLFGLLFAFCLSSCITPDENPAGVLTSESLFRTENDLQAAVTAVYYPLVSDPWGGFGSTRLWIPLMGADDLTCHPGLAKGDFREVDRFVATNLNPGLLNASWRNPYAIVRAANNVLENYQKINGREVVKNQAAAQACFLRAFAYFWMTRIFGDLPLMTTTAPQPGIELSPVKDIYALIVDDLLFARENLPASWPGEPGKPTLWTAKSMLSQVYLTMAGWPLKDESKYALAANEAQDVIDNGPYHLLDNFADLWKMTSGNKGEFIWSIQMAGLSSAKQFSTIVGCTTMPGEENGWDDVFFEVGFYKRFPAGPRKDATFHTEFQKKPGDPIINFQNSTTRHPYIEKYRDGALKYLSSFEHEFMTSRDVCYLRFAEILLTYSEAQTMADGAPSARAYQEINKVRARAGLKNLQAGLSKIAFRDSVVAERGWELAAEYSRWFDLIRTEKVEEVSKLKDPLDMDPLGGVNKTKYHAPVPYQETRLNPNLANGTQYP